MSKRSRLYRRPGYLMDRVLTQLVSPFKFSVITPVQRAWRVEHERMQCHLLINNVAHCVRMLAKV